MTPDKNKKPLPSSTSFIFPERPTTYQQWKLNLQAVKILYLRGQWKHCAARCCQLLNEAVSLPQALHLTYLHFYCALSNEAIARLTHPFSKTKAQLLEQAKASYEAAALSLPVSDRIADLYPTRDNDSWDTHSTSSTESDILGYYQSSPISSSPRDDASLPSSVESIKFPSETITLKPYPLRIRKSTIGVLASTIESTDGHDMHLLNQFPSTPPPAYRPATPPLPRPTPIRFNHPPAAWLRVCSYERYNADLALFAEMLTNHISTTENMIKTTREAQTMRNFSRKLMNYGDDEEDRAADLKARVARLKATGWRRERFRPDRYQELCERALEEL